MQCNIDARGKAVRLAFGLVFTLTGILLLVLGGGAAWSLIAGISTIAGGAFMIFEGAAGWCAVRALGFRTKL